MARWLRAGRISTPHGLDGSIHVVEPVRDLFAVGGTVGLGPAGVRLPDDATPDLRTITRVAGHEKRVILRLSGCEDRSAADALRGLELFVDQSAAPGLGPDEWYAEDLEGCAVHDGETPVGTVRRLLALPSCEVLEVERPDGAEDLLVPLVSDAVRAVDTAARRIDIDLAFLGEA